MWLLKEWGLLIFLELSIVATSGYRVDTKKPTSSLAFKASSPYNVDSQDNIADDVIKIQENFNPGPAEHGGWRKPENPVRIESSHGDNRWHYPDSGGFDSDKDVPKQSESQEGDYILGQTGSKLGATLNFPTGLSEVGKLPSYTGGSLSHGGDLIVGQGSVQRPANLGSQYQGGSFNKGVGSFPVQAHIAPGTSQFSQVISSGSKKPSYTASEHPEYVGQVASGGNVFRKPGQFQQHPAAFSGQQGGQHHDSPSAHPAFSSSNRGPGGSKFPSHPSGGRPAISHQSGQIGPKPGSGIYKQKPAESYHPQGNQRYTSTHFGGNSGFRLGPKISVSGTKFLSPGQPAHHFQQSPNSGIQKYFH